MNEEAVMKVGFIGLGIMGSRMAANLQKKGHELVVYNRTREKADALVAAGALWSPTPAAVASQVKVLITMLSTPDAVAQTAVNGKDAFLQSLEPGSLWIDCSSVNPSFSRTMAEQAKRRGIRFVDAPVAGSKGPAEQAQLIFFAGGEKADVDEARPLFGAMGKTAHHLGGVGMGTSMKMVNNLMLSQAMVAFSEAVVLGESLGIPQDMMLNALLSSPVAAPFLALKRSKIESGSFDTEFPLRWMYKDMQLVAETAYEAGVAIPAAQAAKELYALAVRRGLGGLDFSGVYRILNEKS